MVVMAAVAAAEAAAAAIVAVVAIVRDSWMYRDWEEHSGVYRAVPALR